MTLSLTSHQHHDDGSTTLTVASTPSGLLDRLLRRKASTVAYRGSYDTWRDDDGNHPGVMLEAWLSGQHALLRYQRRLSEAVNQ